MANINVEGPIIVNAKISEHMGVPFHIKHVNINYYLHRMTNIYSTQKSEINI